MASDFEGPLNFTGGMLFLDSEWDGDYYVWSSTLEFFASIAGNASSGPPPIGLHLILGPDTKIKLGNMVSNTRNGLCGPWEIIARKTG